MALDDAPEDVSDNPSNIDMNGGWDDSEDVPERGERSLPDGRPVSNRRTYLQLIGGGITVNGRLRFGTNEPKTAGVGGPQDRSEMVLAAEDTFEDPSLDASNWDVGWGWGMNTRTSPTRVTAENVSIRNGRLELVGTHEDGEILAGGVHTRDKVTVGPGSYFEARVKFPDRAGFLPAFWAKPNDESWPPEIDVVELFQDGDGKADTHESQHHLHYSESTIPGDRSTYEGTGKSHRVGDDLTRNFHVYGVEWRTERLAHYVDGEEVMVTTNPDILNAMERGAPFYLMCSLEINKIGTADASETWGESFVVDWVRVWE
jgi:beta-glucanase (GH16 family)